MQNAAFKALNLDAQYILFEKTPQELAGFLLYLNKEGISGINVTVPYKEKVIPYLSSLSKEAQLIGAVNTIKVSGSKLEGFNTDGEGFIRHLTGDLRFDLRKKNIAMLGAGGASRAVAVYSAIAKVRTLAIYDVDKEKSTALIGQLKNNFKDTEFRIADSLSNLNIQDCALLINATPIGMKESDPLLVEPGLLHKDLLVYDLIYNPAKTKLLQTAEEIGAKASNGLGMLLHQGARSFEIWTGKLAPMAAMRAVLQQKG
jgi:shikimate dehydrogenase